MLMKHLLNASKDGTDRVKEKSAKSLYWWIKESTDIAHKASHGHAPHTELTYSLVHLF